MGKMTTVQFLEWLKLKIPRIASVIGRARAYLKPSEELGRLDAEAVLDFLENLVTAGKMFEDFGGRELLREREELEEIKSVIHLVPALATYKVEGNMEIRDQIKDLVVEHYSKIEEQKAYELYAPLLELSKLKRFRPLPIFTTNYDLAIEKAYELGGAIRLIDGFSRPFATTPRWSREEYDDYATFVGREIMLFKLHGSVDWVCTPSGTIQRVESRQRDPGGMQTIIAYPSRLKKEIHEEPFRTNYDYLLACLLHAKLCVVIGFSFRDQEIVEEIRQAIELNERLELMIFDPNAEAIKTHLEGKIGFELEAELLKKKFTPRNARVLAQKIKTEIKR